ncbi:glycosyltransferase family 4 protein [Candidatus Pelagibacter sp.]|nr:glycosyltransferase family 4 protein [Candidatus Pelagibacter sp.]
MNILFYCPFKFNIESGKSKSLGGIESLNLDLCKALASKNFNIYLASICNKKIKKKGVINIPISKLKSKKNNFDFDIIISSNEPNIFDKYKNAKKILWMHNTLNIEKSIRKKKLIPILRNKIITVFNSNYLKDNTSVLYNFDKKIVIPNFLTHHFQNLKPIFKRKPYFLWSVQRNKGLDQIIDIWIKKINPKNNKVKLLIFGIQSSKLGIYNLKKLYKFNIFFMGNVNKTTLKKYYSKSMGMICLGYDETFCLNVIEGFSCGLPMISFGLSAVKEIVNNRNSFIMNNYNDLDKILFRIYNLDYNKRTFMINNCVNFSKKFYLKNIIDYWYKLLSLKKT